jgi:uncharacterized protein with PIN domain
MQVSDDASARKLVGRLDRAEGIAESAYKCPACGQELAYQPGEAVHIVAGKADLEGAEPRYVCQHCQRYYREIIRNSGLYVSYPCQAGPAVPDTAALAIQVHSPAGLVPTGELGAMLLAADGEGHCRCPRCGAQMDIVAGGPVKIVDGRPDFSDTYDHFVCGHCGSFFRKVAGTQYYQWCED